MSDLDWDDEEFEPSAVVQEKAQWDDEEEEEEEVGGATDEETNEKAEVKQRTWTKPWRTRSRKS